MVSLSGFEGGLSYRSRKSTLNVESCYRVGTDSWITTDSPRPAITAGTFTPTDFAFPLSGEVALQGLTEPVNLRPCVCHAGPDARYHPAAVKRTTAEEILVRGTVGPSAAVALRRGCAMGDLTPCPWFCKALQTLILPDSGPFPVIQSGTFELAVIQGKAQRVDEMQGRARVGAQAYNIAGVGGYLRLKEHHMKHERSMASGLNGAAFRCR